MNRQRRINTIGAFGAALLIGLALLYVVSAPLWFATGTAIVVYYLHRATDAARGRP